ncbi:MAG: hypothetical protein KKC05_01355 [Nanoarchaeota archaeon]|nr:hypothetical protein [Nanoarchaeota archaeon]
MDDCFCDYLYPATNEIQVWEEDINGGEEWFIAAIPCAWVILQPWGFRYYAKRMDSFG